MRVFKFAVVCLIGISGVATSALATEQVYKPVSPTFGGNPLNGNFLLSTAQTQGSGVKSGSQQQAPDLSGLNSALSGIGSQTPVVVINGTNGSNMP